MCVYVDVETPHMSRCSPCHMSPTKQSVIFCPTMSTNSTCTAGSPAVAMDKSQPVQASDNIQCLSKGVRAFTAIKRSFYVWQHNHAARHLKE